MPHREALHYRTLAETAADIRAGRLSSEEVTRHTLDRIGELEPGLHARVRGPEIVVPGCSRFRLEASRSKRRNHRQRGQNNSGSKRQ